MSTPLIALDDLKSRLAIRAGNTDFDDLLSSIIGAVSLQIEAQCRRSFALQEHTEFFHVQAGAQKVYDLYGDMPDGLTTHIPAHPFVLSEAPVENDPAVRVFYDRTRAFGDDTELASTDFTVLHQKGLVYVSYPLARSRDSVKIVYSAGYAAAGDPASLSDSLPADLKLATITQCLYAYKRLGSDNVGLRSEDDSKPSQYIIDGGLLPDVVSMIAPYRKLLRGRE